MPRQVTISLSSGNNQTWLSNSIKNKSITKIISWIFHLCRGTWIDFIDIKSVQSSAKFYILFRWKATTRHSKNPLSLNVVVFCILVNLKNILIVFLDGLCQEGGKCLIAEIFKFYLNLMFIISHDYINEESHHDDDWMLSNNSTQYIDYASLVGNSKDHRLESYLTRKYRAGSLEYLRSKLIE